MSSNVARPPCDAPLVKVNTLTGQREIWHDAPSFAQTEFSHQHPNVAFGLHIVSAPLDGSIRLDDKCGAGATHVLAAVIHLESPCAKGLVQSQVFIDQQREVEFLLLDKPLVGFTGILGNAEDDVVFSVQASHIVSEIAGLSSAAWGGIFGVEVEDDGLAFAEVVLQAV